jgi:hypothetical protein
VIPGSCSPTTFTGTTGVGGGTQAASMAFPSLVPNGVCGGSLLANQHSTGEPGLHRDSDGKLGGSRAFGNAPARIGAAGLRSAPALSPTLVQRNFSPAGSY